MMFNSRFRRRTAGMFNARVPELRLCQVPEVRHRRGKRRWRLATVLRTVLVGLMAGCKGLGELEKFTEKVPRSMRKLLGIPRALPDTTARDIIVRLPDTSLRACLYAQVKTARRRKALEPVGLPFGVVAVDGKATEEGEEGDVFYFFTFVGGWRQRQAVDSRVLKVPAAEARCLPWARSCPAHHRAERPVCEGRCATEGRMTWATDAYISTHESKEVRYVPFSGAPDVSTRGVPPRS